MAVQQSLSKTFENLILYSVNHSSVFTTYTIFTVYGKKNTQHVILVWTRISSPPSYQVHSLGDCIKAREMLFFLCEAVSPQLWTWTGLPILSHLLIHTRRRHYFKFMWLLSLPNSQGCCGPCSSVQEAASEALQAFSVWQNPPRRKHRGGCKRFVEEVKGPEFVVYSCISNLIKFKTWQSLRHRQIIKTLIINECMT